MGVTKTTNSRLHTFKEAALNQTRISSGLGKTSSVHDFYRYPARFSPQFAASAIQVFTNQGDTVLDPFMGGGTVMVEANRLGRNAVGIDVNPIATFTTRAKTHRYNTLELEDATNWLRYISGILNIRNSPRLRNVWQEKGYFRHLNTPDTWRIRNLIALAIESLDSIPTESAQMLCRCAILRTSQWALDMRKSLPSVHGFRSRLFESTRSMIEIVGNANQRAANKISIFERKIPCLGRISFSPPALILTSPPYPGVYVNYHRWKLKGRKETPALFWIVNKQDGHGMAHYTMGARSDRERNRYFLELLIAWKDIASVTTSGTYVVQIVGFKKTNTDLPRYLNTMEQAGFKELQHTELGTAKDGRLWRDVPNRRWWVTTSGRQNVAPDSRQEVVLIHRKT